jgi:FKBP-type peptidyl-prolyl cis-trans isomerase FklB
MRMITFCLILCLAFSFATQAQEKNLTTKKTEVKTSNRFAYSYGVLLGDNLKKIGLTMDLFSMNKMEEGITLFMSGKDLTITQEGAQKALNAKMTEIQADKTARAAGKKVTTITKTSLDNFYINYGIVIAANWKQFGLAFEDVSMEEFESGIDAMVTGNVDLTAQTAQANVSAEYQMLSEKKDEETLRLNDAFMEENKKKPNVVSLASGIQYEILEKGKGIKATAESKVTTHYHGTLINGNVFDSSVEKGKPISFSLSGVIKGWQEIIPMMKEGAKWRIFVPSHMGYGSRQRGAQIPSNSLLIFEIELISVY